MPGLMYSSAPLGYASSSSSKIPTEYFIQKHFGTQIAIVFLQRKNPSAWTCASLASSSRKNLQIAYKHDMRISPCSRTCSAVSSLAPIACAKAGFDGVSFHFLLSAARLQFAESFPMTNRRNFIKPCCSNRHVCKGSTGNLCRRLNPRCQRPFPLMAALHRTLPLLLPRRFCRKRTALTLVTSVRCKFCPVTSISHQRTEEPTTSKPLA